MYMCIYTYVRHTPTTTATTSPTHDDRRLCLYIFATHTNNNSNNITNT